LYKKPPPGIILYGHSLGGVVSQLVLEDEEIRNKISMVVALASPFNEPRSFIFKVIKHYLKKRLSELLIFSKNSLFLNF
jgi:alpha-beta hydrolase superfamily lysophospholipase